MMLVCLLAVLITSGQSYASTQWPFPQGPYPRDAVYYQYFLESTSQNQSSDRSSGVVRDNNVAVPSEAETDKSMQSLGDTDNYENYDYWASQ